ncbi:MAG: hypothetical protein ACN6NV_12175 [Acinetobacter gandensis]|uniref:hypothetical protein n=1 Tax=Acinetobacter gandensis TaxID=1443941 RepID=UPI003D020FFA
MKKTHFKLSFIILLIFTQGCATNDSNSPLVRFWNDGFIYNEKKMDDGQNCSGEANAKYPNLKPVDAMWLQYYENCMKKRGY